MKVLSLLLEDVSTGKLYNVGVDITKEGNAYASDVISEIKKQIDEKESELSTDLLLVEAGIKDSNNFEDSIPEQIQEMENLWKKQHEDKEKRKNAR